MKLPNEKNIHMETNRNTPIIPCIEISNNMKASRLKITNTKNAIHRSIDKKVGTFFIIFVVPNKYNKKITEARMLDRLISSDGYPMLLGNTTINSEVMNSITQKTSSLFFITITLCLKTTYHESWPWGQFMLYTKILRTISKLTAFNLLIYIPVKSFSLNALVRTFLLPVVKSRNHPLCCPRVL